MNAQTITTAASFTIPTVSAQTQKKVALSVAVLALGGIMLVLFAALWMPTLMMLDMALTLGLVATVVTGAPVKSSAIFALKIAACMAIGAGYALVGLVLYTLYTF